MWLPICGLLIICASSSKSQVYFPESHQTFGQIANLHDGASNEHSSAENTFYNTIDHISGNRVENSVSQGLTSFALNLNKAIINRIGKDTTDNIVLSPLSIAGSLSLLLLGSVGNTYQELARTLGFFPDMNTSPNVHREFGSLLNSIVTKNFSLGPKLNPNVTYGNAIFLQNDFPIRQQYEDFIRNVYNSRIVHVNYKQNAIDAQKIINRWVSEATNEKITDILSSPPSVSTRLIIASALYFNGEWEKYFPEELTQRAPFFLNKSDTNPKITVDMMAMEGTFPYYKSIEHECELIGLPYKGNNTFMYAIKPLNSDKKDLYQIINEMAPATLEMLIKNAKPQSSIVTFPKMKLTSSNYLRSALEDMGTKSLFSRAHANLALLSPINLVGPLPLNIDRLETDNDRNGDQLIFSRFGGDSSSPLNTTCDEVFNTDSPNAMCTTKEIVNGKIVNVTYKKIGEKIGRKIQRRNIRTSRQRRNSMEALNPGLYVDEVIHKVDMDITETGTEAAAATLAFVTRHGRRPVFKGNEPFMFLIRNEDTKFILFSAIINKPTPNYLV